MILVLSNALSGFRDGKYRILVATDIAARGIDVSGISHVINYDMPDTVDAYTHRIGRTGRAAKTGDAFTFVTPEDRGFVGDIEHVLGERIERRTLEGFDYNLPAPAGGGSDRSSRSSFGRQRPAPISRYAPARRGGDYRHAASRPVARRSGVRSLAGCPQLRGSSR